MKNTLLLNVFAGVLLAVSMASAQNMDSIFVRRNYGKQEYQLPMRDGITLYTIVYTPKDKSHTYPIMMNVPVTASGRMAKISTCPYWGRQNT